MCYSIDGISWNKTENAFSSGIGLKLAYNKKVVVAVGKNTVYFSRDGISLMEKYE